MQQFLFCRDLEAALLGFNALAAAGADAVSGALRRQSEAATLPAMLRALDLLLTEPAARARQLQGPGNLDVSLKGIYTDKAKIKQVL